MSKLKNVFKDWYQPHRSFVVRNPLFPVDTFFNWKAGSVDSVLSRSILLNGLKEFYRQPLAKEALYVASPDLHQQLQLWLENKIESPEKKERTELSLIKYMIRMCTRCTPYGLFASCSTGNFSDAATGSSSIQLGSRESIRRHGRLDMDFVCELHAHILKQKKIAGQIAFFPNTSLYRLGDQWRYIEQRFAQDTGRSYHLVEIGHSVYLEKILKESVAGKKPAELAALITDEEIPVEEVAEFIDELIDSQVLVDELAPVVTGEEYFSVLLKKLAGIREAEKFIEPLEKVVKLFTQLRWEDDKEKNGLYPEIARHLQPLGIPIHLKTLVQVDSFRASHPGSLNQKLNDEVLKGISLLQLLTTELSSPDHFTEFKTAFTRRYETEFVPLTEVLDTESGIGYGRFALSSMEESPLIDKLPIGNGMAEPHAGTFADAEAFKWQLYLRAIEERKTGVLIDDKTIEQLSISNKPSGLADSICTMIKVLASSGEEIDRGNYQIALQAPSGPSGANLLGRFCHLDPGIEKLVADTLAEEEAHRPEAIYAEIVHLPESRIGNILMRPALRQYEIAYLCNTTAESDFQISVSDLLVGIRNDKVMIWSKKLGREIIPRLTTAHNYHSTTLSVYQFLCDLQYQGIRPIGWNWGILEGRPFLPRVSYGKFIFSKARWVLTKEEVKAMDKKEDDELLNGFLTLRKARNIPEYVLLSQGDNELALHLGNIFCVRLLLNEVKKTSRVTLTEILDTPGHCWIESNGDKYAGEFILSFSLKKEGSGKLPASSPAFHAPQDLKRKFPVGSEWLYAKIYCGAKTAERLLAEIVRPFTGELLSEKIIDKFFFLRYHDGANHIRIRFHKSGDDGFWKKVISRLQHVLQPYFQNHLVHNLQFETYIREVERYGADTMELSEDVFMHQSRAILDFVSLLDGDEGEQYRWQAALKAIDLILDDFSYTLEQKRDLVKKLNKNFSDEFKIGSAERKKISERFADDRQTVNVIMNGVPVAVGGMQEENLEKAINIFKNDDACYRQSVKKILTAGSVRQYPERLDELMASYLHMFINRMFVSNQRKVELVIYEYLWKYYESRLRRPETIPAITNEVS